MIHPFGNHLQSNHSITNTCTTHSYNPTPLTDHSSGAQIPCICSRTICDDQSNNCKYAEKISFNNAGSNYPVVIGYNPALNSQQQIDKTNALIANYLNGLKYDGYYLFNKFPDVSNTKVTKNNSSYQNYLSDVLNFLNNNVPLFNTEIMIFGGSTVYVTQNVERLLRDLISKGCQIYTFGHTSGKKHIRHKHPGRGVSASTIQHVPNSLNTLTAQCRFIR